MFMLLLMFLLFHLHNRLVFKRDVMRGPLQYVTTSLGYSNSQEIVQIDKALLLSDSFSRLSFSETFLPYPMCCFTVIVSNFERLLC